VKDGCHREAARQDLNGLEPNRLAYGIGA